MQKQLLPGVVMSLLAAAFSGNASSQSYPAKPIRFVVPWPAGGVADITTRLVGRKLGENMGQTFVVDNRAGATGIIGCEFVARAAPDGYTLLMGTTTTHATNPVMFKKLPYDPIRDFAPISLVADAPFVLLVHPSLPVRSVKELIAFAKARPGQLTYGSSGIGGSSHLGFELFIPTISESGLKGFELGSWSAMFAPAATPPDIVRRLQREVVVAIADPSMREQFAALGAEPVGSTPEELASVLKRDVVKWGKVARQANLQPE